MTDHGVIIPPEDFQIKECQKNDKEQEKKKVFIESKDEEEENFVKNFPWFQRFLQTSFQFIGINRLKALETLVFSFLRNVFADAQECYTRPTKAVKLKKIVYQMLVYFHSLYQDIYSKNFKIDLENSAYLGLMSELVAVYIDLEIKASRLQVESLKKIGQVICTALFAFLEALLRAKLIIKTHEELCGLILSTFLKTANCVVRHESEYIRFLLLFKLWKLIETDADERKKITRIAFSKLQPSSEMIRGFETLDWMAPVFSKMTPRNATLVLMSYPFDFFKVKSEFLKESTLRMYNSHKHLAEAAFSYPNFSLDSFYLLDSEYVEEVTKSDAASTELSYDLDSYFDSYSYDFTTEFLGSIKEDNSDVVLIVEAPKNSLLPIESEEDEKQEGEVEDKNDILSNQNNSFAFEEEVDGLVEKENFARRESEPSSLKSPLNIEASRESFVNVEVEKIAFEENVKGQEIPSIFQSQMNFKETLIDQKPKAVVGMNVESVKKIKYENIAKFYKIVKSNALKNDTQNSAQTNLQIASEKKTLKKFNFAPKLVKITEDELKGNKPSRAKSWRYKGLAEKSLSRKKEKRKKLNKNEANVLETSKSKSSIPDLIPSQEAKESPVCEFHQKTNCALNSEKTNSNPPKINDDFDSSFESFCQFFQKTQDLNYTQNSNDLLQKKEALNLFSEPLCDDFLKILQDCSSPTFDLENSNTSSIQSSIFEDTLYEEMLELPVKTNDTYQECKEEFSGNKAKLFSDSKMNFQSKRKGIVYRYLWKQMLKRRIVKIQKDFFRNCYYNLQKAQVYKLWTFWRKYLTWKDLNNCQTQTCDNKVKVEVPCDCLKLPLKKRLKKASCNLNNFSN